MKKITTIILFVFLQQIVLAQKVEINGYFEPQLMVAEIKNEILQLGSNKLRVDFQYKPTAKTTFGANVNYIAYHGKTEWNILDYLPTKMQAEAPELNFLGYELNPYLLPFQERHYLDNAYIRLSFKRLDLTIGKQQLSMGTGYVWNPTDVFNRKDIADPTYEQPGHNAIRLDIPLGSRTGLTGIYAPTDRWEDSDLLLKIKSHIFHFDFSIMAMQKQWRYTDSRIVDPIQQKFYQINTKRQIIGGDFAGELFGIGLWAEAAYNHVNLGDQEKIAYQSAFTDFVKFATYPYQPLEIKDHYTELVFGMDYTFDFQTYIMAEYYENTEVPNNSAEYNLNDWMHYFLSEKKTISRKQVYWLVQHPVTDLVQLGLSTIYSISDQSMAFIPMITYPFTQNIELSCFLTFYQGKEGTAYNKNLGNGGVFRLRIYF
ncbi:hypothetical protein JW964_05030 [candidate division KSB1 bacterium]|nr:hypothetical protein [candidate division KSB1 bacterium]